jgi:DNA polymerase-3 subunit epsilon
MREIIFDTETTGLSPEQGHKVIEIGCVELIDKRKTGKSFQIYINPDRDVPNEAFKIHGISTEFLQDKPKFHQCHESFLEFIADSKLIAHNASFDMKFINFELALLKLPQIINSRVLDTLQIARKKFPGAQNSLNALCKRFNIDLAARNYHGALLDAELLADVYLKLMAETQGMMQFVAKAPEILAMPEPKIYREARSFAVFEEEVWCHEELVKRLKNPLWQS